MGNTLRSRRSCNKVRHLYKVSIHVKWGIPFEVESFIEQSKNISKVSIHVKWGIPFEEYSQVFIDKSRFIVSIHVKWGIPFEVLAVDKGTNQDIEKFQST